VTALPTGTLTLLFSDIEGSTALLHRLGPRWGEALSQQRAIMRAAFGTHHGVEMGTEGDSFFVVFRSAHDAVGAAVEAQRALQEHTWSNDAELRVRVGIHTGEPERHEDGYIGADVHRAARIGSTANGGQIVVSGATRKLVGDLAGVTIRDLGYHRLKDLPGSEQLFDLAVPGLLSDFPPLRSLGRTATLPVAPTELVGRDDDLRALGELLRDPRARLVTVTGHGGAGKTRLAVAAATELAAMFPDGVYFVDLHAVEKGEAMWQLVGEALDAGGSAESTAAVRVFEYLAARGALLVLDNLEQIRDADQALAALLGAAPRVRVLATSRRALLLAGEREYPVAPLDIPVAADLASVVASPAAQLFAQYARMARPSFELNTSNSAAVEALCRELDGLPLALELAAAHVRTFGLRTLLSRLDGRLGHGVTAADRPDRHRTLHATISWSYHLLDRQDQAVLRRMGVFAGHCGLDAFAAVAVEPGEDDVLDVAARLAGTSLVRIEEGADGEPRLVLLETIRAFARDRLDECGETEAARLAHLRWCAGVVDGTVGMLGTSLHTVALDRLDAISNDIRAALTFTLDAGPDGDRREIGYRLLIEATSKYWYPYISVREARAWQERAVASIGAEDTASHVELLHGLGVSMMQQSEVDAAIAVFERSLAMAGRFDNDDLAARALNDLAVAHRRAGRFAESRALLERSLDVARRSGNTRHQAIALGNLVVIHIDLGDYVNAAEAAQRSMAINAASGDELGVAIDRLNYTAAVLHSEGAEVAHQCFRDWAERILAFRDVELSIDLTELGAAIAAGRGHAVVAAQVLGVADAQRAAAGLPRSSAEDDLVAQYLAPARAALSAPDWDDAYRDGSALSAEQAIRLVQSG
jgi:predicted ATPase/class 3 adenylate cyclase